MENHSIGTLVLEGQDSIDFVNSLISPSNDIIEHFETVFDRLEKSITVVDCYDGITANIKDYDLSFLSDIDEEHIVIQTNFKINVDDVVFSDVVSELDKVTVNVVEDNLYCNSNGNNYLSWAA